MLFTGYSRIFSTRNDGQYETIGVFWDELSALYGMEQLRGLGCHWTGHSIEYIIGRKDNQRMEQGLPESCMNAQWKEIELPDTGWERYQGRTEHLQELYDRIYQKGVLEYEIECFTEEGNCELLVFRE